MKKLSLFLLLFLGGCYTQFTVVEPQKRNVVVIRNEYYTPIYPYSLYRWEYYSRYYPYNRYYLIPEYRWYYYTSPRTETPQTRRSNGVQSPQPRRQSGVQPPQKTESGRRAEVNGGSRRDGENVRRGSEGAERTRRPERRVEVTEGGKRETGNVRRGSTEVERTKRPERRVE